MKTKKYWKNNGSKDKPLYNFLPPNSWNIDRINIESKKYIEDIKRKSEIYSKDDEWIKEVRKIPEKLISILLDEIKKGNFIKSVSNSDWPNKGSIAINLANRFNDENKKIPGTVWRELNDPHYCNEEISEISNSIEYILIN